MGRGAATLAADLQRRGRIDAVLSAGSNRVSRLVLGNAAAAISGMAAWAAERAHVHNAAVTLMRTSEAEMAELGNRMAQALREAQGPAEVFWPRRGLSALDAESMPFRDPEADDRGLASLQEGLRGSKVMVHVRDEHLNDAAFGRAMARRLHRLIADAAARNDRTTPEYGRHQP